MKSSQPVVLPYTPLTSLIITKGLGNFVMYIKHSGKEESFTPVTIEQSQ